MHHLFQPLLYQVATGILSEGEIAPATREILRGQPNARVLLGDVLDVDPDARTLTFAGEGTTTTLPYDSLVVAAGAGQSYFGNDHFAEHAPGMKTVDDALELRGRIFTAFERAELATTPEEVARALTFVVVGAGPTGVEMAGQIAELAHRTLRGEFRSIAPSTSRIILLDAADRVLPPFHPALSQDTHDRLRRMGVDVRLKTRVTDLDGTGLTVVTPDGATRRIEAETIMWAAGVEANPLGRLLAERTGAADRPRGPRARRARHERPRLPGRVRRRRPDGARPAAGVAQVAIQSGRTPRRRSPRASRATPAGAFRYFDKVDGHRRPVRRGHADRPPPAHRVGRLGRVAVRPPAVPDQLQEPVTTLLRSAISFLGRGRTQRAVTKQQIVARTSSTRRGAPGPARARAGGPPRPDRCLTSSPGEGGVLAGAPRAPRPGTAGDR